MLFRQRKFHYILLVVILATLILFALISRQMGMIAQAQIIKVQEAEIWHPFRDWQSDNSLTKYLSADTPFNNPDYAPVDLAPIDSSFTANNSQKYSLRSEAAVQFADMAWHFWHDMDGARLWIASAYRGK